MEKIFFNTANVISDEEFRQNQCDFYNRGKGKLNEIDGIDCPKCKNRGRFAVPREDSDEYRLVDCECMKMRDLRRREIKSNLGDFLKLRSKDYLITEEWQNVNRNLLREYCSTCASSNNWFMLVGTSGCGKTMMSCIIANHYLYNLGKEVIFITWTDFIGKLKRDLMNNNAGLVSEYFQEIKNVEVLVIDELLKNFNDTDLKYIVEIINDRYVNNKITIITSERRVSDLLDIDEATFSRVVQKCGKFIIDIPKDRTKNYRLKNTKLEGK